MPVYKVPWWYVSFLNSAIGFSNPNVAEWLLHFVVANKEWTNLISFFILPFPAVLLKGQVSLQQESICWLNGDCWDCWDNFSGISCIDACTVIIVSISSFIPLYMFLCHIASKFSPVDMESETLIFAANHDAHIGSYRRRGKAAFIWAPFWLCSCMHFSASVICHTYLSAKFDFQCDCDVWLHHFVWNFMVLNADVSLQRRVVLLGTPLQLHRQLQVSSFSTSEFSL